MKDAASVIPFPDPPKFHLGSAKTGAGFGSTPSEVLCTTGCVLASQRNARRNAESNERFFRDSVVWRLLGGGIGRARHDVLKMSFDAGQSFA